MYPYKAKISEELDHSKFYRGKLVSPGNIVDIHGPEDEKIFKDFLIPYHEETEAEKEAAIAKPLNASFVHGTPKAPITNLSDEFKAPKAPSPATNNEADAKEEAPKESEGKDTPPATEAKEEAKTATSKAGDKKK